MMHFAKSHYNALAYGFTGVELRFWTKKPFSKPLTKEIKQLISLRDNKYISEDAKGIHEG